MVTAMFIINHNFFVIDIYLLSMKSENIVCEEWKGYRPNMPVKVVGVKDGKITSNEMGLKYLRTSKMHRKSIQTLIPKKIPNDLLG